MSQEKSAEEKKAEKRENDRKAQLEILSDDGLKLLYVASRGLDVAAYGSEGREKTTLLSYLPAMESGSPGIGKILGSFYARQAGEALQSKQDPYDLAGPGHIQVVKYARGFYESGWNSIFVFYALKLLEVKKVHEKRISEEDMNLTMGEFAKKNKEMYGILTSNYFEALAQEGVGTALLQDGAMKRKGLEHLLKSDPEKKEKEE